MTTHDFKKQGLVVIVGDRFESFIYILFQKISKAHCSTKMKKWQIAKSFDLTQWISMVQSFYKIKTSEAQLHGNFIKSKYAIHITWTPQHSQPEPQETSGASSGASADFVAVSCFFFLASEGYNNWKQNLLPRFQNSLDSFHMFPIYHSKFQESLFVWYVCIWYYLIVFV